MVKEKDKLKDRISGRRVVAGYLCGAAGYNDQLIEGSKNFIHMGMIRGSKNHSIIESWAREECDLPKNWQKLFPPREDIASSEEAFVRYAEGVERPVLSILDIVSKDKVVYEAKSGEPSEWHKLQADVYRWTIKSDVPAKLAYLDKGILTDVPMVVDDEFIRKAWANIEEGKPEKCDWCKICSIKSSCELWVTKADDNIQKLIDITRDMKLLEGKIDAIKVKFVQSIKKKVASLKELESKNGELRELAKSRYKITYKNFDSGDAVSVFEQQVKVLPKNYLEIVPYNDENSHFYKLEPRKELKDAIGIYEPANRVTVRLKNKQP